MSDSVVLQFAEYRLRVVARTPAAMPVLERLGVLFAAFCVEDAGADGEVVVLEGGDDPLGRAVVALSTAALASARGRWAIHAAACTWRDRTVLLPAGSGCGKSMLVAHLVARGAMLLSDEVAWLEPTSFGVHPFPRAIVLERDATALDASARRNAGIEEIGAAGADTVALELPAHRIARAPAAAPSVLVFPSFEASSSPRLAPVSRARAVAGLLELTLHPPEPGPAAPLDLALALVRRTPCFAMRYPSSDEASAMLARALESAG